MRGLAVQLGIALVVGIMVQVPMQMAIGLGGLVAAGATKSTESVLPAVWTILGIAALGTPLAGCMASFPLVRAAGSTLPATTAGAYAGLAAALTWAWWLGGHSADPFWLLLWFYPIAGIGAGTGAFIGVTSRSALARRPKITAAATAVLLTCSAAAIFTLLEYHDPRYVQIRQYIEQEQIRRKVAQTTAAKAAEEPPPQFLWQKRQTASPELTAVAEDGTRYMVHQARLRSESGDGRAAWDFDAGGQITSIALGSDRTIYLCAEGGEISSFVALDAGGREKWRTRLGGKSGSCAIASDGRIFVTGTAIRAFRPDGKLVWQHKPAGVEFGSVSIGNDGTLYVEGLHECLHAISDEGKELWKFCGGVHARGYPRWTTLVSRDGTLFVASSSLFSLSANGELLWRSGFSLMENNAAVILADGTIVAAGVNGVLYGVTPSSTRKWMYPAQSGEQIRGVTAAPDGTLRVQYESSLVALDPKLGPLASDAWPLPRHDSWNTGRAGAAYKAN